MKKVLALLLVISFGAAFVAAEGVNFGGWTRVVYTLAQWDQGVKDISQVRQGVGPGWWGQGIALGFNVNYNGPVFGFHASYSTSSEKQTLFPVADGGLGGLQTFNLSLNAIADMLTITIGKYKDDSFRQYMDPTAFPDGDIDWKIGRFDTSRVNFMSANTAVGGSGMGNLDGAVAINLMFAPKGTGLKVAFMLPTGIYGAGGTLGATPIQRNLENFFLAASLNIEGLGTIAAGTTPTEGNSGKESWRSAGSADTTREIFVGFTLTAIEGLTVLATAAYDLNGNQYAAAVAPTVEGNLDNVIGEVGVKLNIDSFNVGLTETFELPIGTSFNGSLTTLFDANFNLGPITAGASAKVGFSTAPGYPGLSIFPYIVINAINTKIGIKYDGTLNPASNYQWSIPVSFDFGF